MSNTDHPDDARNRPLPAGWYPDQSQVGMERRWDGKSWGSETRATGGSDKPELAPESSPPHAAIRTYPERAFRWVAQHRLMAIVGAASIVVLIIVATTVPALLGGRQDIKGILVLSDEIGDVSGTWDDCEGTGGYSDIQSGAAASVRNGEGDIVGSLDVENMSEESLRDFVNADERYELGWDAEGNYEETLAVVKEGADLEFTCWLFVTGEVDESNYYAIEVAGRGELSYSKEELAEQGWWFTVSLGG